MPAFVTFGRILFAVLFIYTGATKLFAIQATADYIASAGFPIPLLLAWVAALFESLLVLAFLTGAFFSEAALLAAAYVLFLAFAFHGPAHWTGNQAEFGFFIDHFTFIAGLLFAAASGPGRCAGGSVAGFKVPWTRDHGSTGQSVPGTCG